jgi:hypothetical protein
MIVAPAGVGRGDWQTNRDTDREDEDDAHDANSFRDQQRGCARDAGFIDVSEATRREEVVNTAVFLIPYIRKRKSRAQLREEACRFQRSACWSRLGRSCSPRKDLFSACAVTTMAPNAVSAIIVITDALLPPPSRFSDCLIVLHKPPSIGVQKIKFAVSAAERAVRSACGTMVGGRDNRPARLI